VVTAYFEWAWQVTLEDYGELRERTHGLLAYRECEVLAEAAAAGEVRVALEVGHYGGLSTVVLLKTLPTGSTLVTIDHHEGDSWTAATSAEGFVYNVQPFLNGRVTMDPWFMDFETALRADSCVLAFDDADWDSVETLERLAADDGFVDTGVEVKREAMAKNDPDTQTIRVMRRD